MSRNAMASSRGYLYQNMMTVLKIFEHVYSSGSIIEEGDIEGKIYEDITIICEDKSIITYQVKYQSKQIPFSPSSYFYKTLDNKNNVGAKVFYIVGGNEYCKNIKFWNKMEPSEKYDFIKRKKPKDTINPYDIFERDINCLKKDVILEYLGNVVFEYGPKIDILLEIFDTKDTALISYDIRNYFMRHLFDKKENR